MISSFIIFLLLHHCLWDLTHQQMHQLDVVTLTYCEEMRSATLLNQINNSSWF